MPTTLCLNMIVKNESKIILRLLESVLPIIDSYCICDTGSTDSTIDIIQLFFDKHGLPGKIIKEPFRDFGYNRTHALRQCNDMDKADFLLLLDADMVLDITNIDVKEFKENMKADVYHIFQGHDAFFYKNVRIIRNDPKVSYWGVTHEYVQTPPNYCYEDIPKNKIFIKDIGDGGSKSEKFERDIRLLSKGLEELPNNDRYTFYLANSYRDAGKPDQAIEYYKKRIEIGGWREEVWFSYYMIGKCYKEMGDFANALHYWLEGYNFFPDRIENLYQIITYYRTMGKNKLAYTFYEMADYERNRSTTTDHLFLEKDIYDYKIDYEFSIIGYYCNRNKHCIDTACMRVLANKCADENTQKNVISNYKFYATKLRELAKDDSEILFDIGSSNIVDTTDMVSSTPSLCFDKTSGELVVNVRFINYRIGEQGEYINRDRIVTKNVIATFKHKTDTDSYVKTGEFELKYETKYDNLYVGLEDVRLFTSNSGQVLFNANRGLSYECMVIEHGQINLKSHQTQSYLVKKENQRPIEKNWTIFQDHGDASIKMVYEWYPLTIGLHRDHPEHILDGENRPVTDLDCRWSIETPPFFKWLRGSTNGLSMLNPTTGSRELWFICHIVSYEDRRYYYHIFVVLDALTYEVKRYSRFFTFEGQKVEYTLGFVYLDEKKEFLIGYSLMDRETKYMRVGLMEIEGLMK